MAAASDNSKQLSDRTAQRAAEFHRMKRIAGGLLALMVVLFVAATLVPRHWPEATAAAHYLRAFAEAAMVGAIADWFAVVALFRRPFGLPIPHTAIIARNKNRIGESLGAFICNNFLAPDVVAAKLDSLDAAGRLAHWLAEPENSGKIARRAGAFVPALLDALEDQSVRAFARQAMSRGLASAKAAPLAGEVLAVLMARGHHHALFDRILDMAAGFLFRNETLIRAKVADRSWKWVPRWVDEKLADKLMIGALDTLSELRDPAHPWREEFQIACLRLADRLTHDPDMLARGEAMKADILHNPAVQDYLDTVWSEAKARLKDDVAANEPVLRAGIERAVATFAARLGQDARLRAVVNRWLRRTIERLAVPYRADIGGFIAGVVARWDTDTLVSKLELQVGKDLQYIRINGTVVGGMVGVLIHAVAQAIG